MKTIVLVAALLLGSLPAMGQVGTAVRELPFDFHPGDLIEVRIQVTPPAVTTNWSVREFYPNRWDFISTTNTSSTNEFTGELFFGPFTNDTARTLAYEILSNPGLTNSVNFTGHVAFNFSTNMVAVTTFLPSRNDWLFVGAVSLFGDQSQSSISGTAYGAGRWLASSAGWVTTLESGGRLTHPRCLRYYGHSRLAYVGGLFLHFGANPDSVPLMTISDDGLSWMVGRGELDPYSDPFAGRGLVQSVAYGNGVYVAVGHHRYLNEPGEEGAIFISTNGYNWRRVKRVGNPSRPVNAVAFTNGLFKAVANLGTLLSSTNGLDWTEIRPISGNSAWTNRNLQGICHGPSGWIIPTGDPGKILRSADGETWTELTGTGSPPNDIFWQSFYADDKYWFTPGAYTTTNGTSWTRLPSLPPPQPNGVVSRAPDGVNPRFLGAGASAGSLVLSTNGANWTTSVPGGG